MRFCPGVSRLYQIVSAMSDKSPRKRPFVVSILLSPQPFLPLLLCRRELATLENHAPGCDKPSQQSLCQLVEAAQSAARLVERDHLLIQIGWRIGKQRRQ